MSNFHEWFDPLEQGINETWADATPEEVCGQRTSRMTKQEMSDMQTLMEAFGAERGVVWTHKEIEA